MTMFSGMKIINCEAFLKGLEEFNCGKTDMFFLDAKDFEIPQTSIKPLSNYKPPKKFPDCCEKHKQLFNIGLEKFAKFPNCCEAHKKLNSAKWFNKNDYAYMPLKVVTTVTYTWHCISECIEKDTWYKEITDYIDMTARSFGGLPKGYGPPVGIELYLYNMQREIENKKEMPAAKRNELVDYFKNWGISKPETEKTDVALLVNTYKTWVKDFPFEIPFFSNLKPYFEKQMPILSGKGETNIYTGITAFRLTTYDKLIEFLVNTTERIINEVNTLVLYEKGLITDIQKTNIDIINSSHRFNLKRIKENNAKGRNQYLKVIKSWFKYEKEYLNDLTTALTKVIPAKSIEERKKSSVQSPAVALFCQLVNESEVIVRGPDETILSYCKRVCNQYKLPFKDKVRQWFSKSSSRKNIQKVKAFILPNIDEISRVKLLEYLENKQQVKQKMYV